MGRGSCVAEPAFFAFGSGKAVRDACLVSSYGEKRL
jgi:hypothetical protein